LLPGGANFSHAPTPGSTPFDIGHDAGEERLSDAPQ
jgi:hypothetical protein